jgi:hypothetical protein
MRAQGAPCRAPPGACQGWEPGVLRPIRSHVVLVKSLLIAGVLVLPVPALITGCRGLLRRPGLSRQDPHDRASFVVLVTVRLVTLVLLFLLSGITLVSAVGAMIRGVSLHGLVYVFFVLDLLLAALVVLTFGRRERRPARRRAIPAQR